MGFGRTWKLITRSEIQSPSILFNELVYCVAGEGQRNQSDVI